VGGMAVQATGTGQTSVIARIGGKQIAAQLDVVPGSGLATTDLVGTGIDTYGIDSYGGDSYGGDSYGVTDGVTGRGYRRITSGDPVWDAIIGDGTRTVVRRDGRDGVVRRYIDDGLDAIAGRGIPGAEVVGLQFIPDTLRLPMSSPGTWVQVVERLEDGRLGRDVSNNPNLEIRSPEPIASMQRTEQGLLIAPKQPGATRLTANLGPMTADPMLLTVGDANFTGARLRVSPDPLVLWTGQEGTFSQVELEPSGGQWSFPVDYRIEPEPGQGVVQTVDDVTLLGTAEGQARVRVTAVAPGQEYDGVSTAATVSVRRSDPIVIEPSDMMLTIGQSTPVVKVYAKATDGEMYQVPAELASMDPNVLVPDPLQPGQFSAQALGGTQIRATYRGREALAKVNVSGDRFTDVQTSLNEGDGGFSVTIEVLAAESAGSLEYRVYPAGQQPAENWVPSQPSATGGRRAVLRSPTLPYGERGKLYHLTLEAKNPADGSVQQYPLTFRLGTTIERVGGP